MYQYCSSGGTAVKYIRRLIPSGYGHNDETLLQLNVCDKSYIINISGMCIKRISVNLGHVIRSNENILDL